VITQQQYRMGMFAVSAAVIMALSAAPGRAATATDTAFVGEKWLLTGTTLQQQPGAPLPSHLHPLRRGADGVLRETQTSTTVSK